MKNEKLIKRQYFIVIALIVVVHFVTTSIIVHYISKDIGTKVGQVVAEGIIESYESQEPSNADNIYENMKHEADTMVIPWSTALYISTLPTGPFLEPFWKRISKEWIYTPTLANKLTGEQFKIRIYIVHYFSMGINSLAFGILLYLAVWVFYISNEKEKLNIDARYLPELFIFTYSPKGV